MENPAQYGRLKVADQSPIVPGESEQSSLSTAEIVVYFGILNLALGLAAPHSGLLAIPINYLLKDNLHLGPVQVATFLAVTSSPGWVSFLFGFLRDRFRFLLGGDRGWLALAAVATAACYLWLAFMVLDLRALTAMVLAAMICFLFMSSAAQAMLTAVAQARRMSGTLSATSLSGIFVPIVLAAVAGGWIVTHLSARGTFVAAASVTLVVLIQMIVSVNPEDTIQSDSHPERSLAAIKRIATYRPIWAATLIWFLWGFSPGLQTPMFYHLTNTVKISPQAFGVFMALFMGCNLPTLLVYGPLCRRFPLSRLVRWGTALGVLQPLVLLFAFGTRSAMLVGVIGGLVGGLGNVAFMDLIIRSCPRGLEGTGVMLSMAAFRFAWSSGDVFGSWVYARGGFSTAMLVSATSTALIFPIIWWMVPPGITSTREGESIELVSSPATG
jgi:predicted MFS family arabinose efflux permease